MILATVKCVSHLDAVEAREQVAPAPVQNCRPVVLLDAAGSVLLVEPKGTRATDDNCGEDTSKIGVIKLEKV